MKFGRLQNGLLRSQPETAPSNFISNPTPLKDTTGWSLYSDAAGTAPVDGTGGSPTVTWTRTTSSPLSETASFLFTKDAANRQGQGVSYDFTINRADQAKVCRIDFDYEVASGTYADGDLTVWLYDVTNGGAPIQPSASSILNAIGPQKKQPLSFQTNSNSTSYRLIIHVASTSASAYTVKFDNVSVTRESISQGTVVTDWVSYTPTGSWSTNTTYTGRWRRIGDTAEIQVRLALSGAPTAATLTVNLPSGFVIDTSKLAGGTTQVELPNSDGSMRDDASYNGFSKAFYDSTTTVGIRSSSTASAHTLVLVNATTPITWAANDSIDVTFRVPIVGWSSSQQLSSDAETRVVAAKATLSGNQTVSSSAITKVTFNQTDFNTDGAFDTTNNRFIVKTPGIYDVAGSLRLSGVNTAEFFSIYIFKNGSNVYRMDEYTDTTSVFLEGGSSFSAVAGDYFEIYVQSSGDASYTVEASSSSTVATFSKKSGPAQIAANEQIFAKATSSTTTVGTSATVIINPTVVKNTHGAYNSSTGQFTCPAAGDYEIVVGWNSGSAVSSSSIGSGVLGYIRKNTGLVSLISEFMYQQNTTSIFPHNYAKGTIPGCIAGDVIDFTLQRSASISSFALDGNAQDCWIEFRRIG